MEFSRQRLCEGAKRGDLTGPNPTDRAKSGVKRHILTDGRGMPIAALISGANVLDAAMIDAASFFAAKDGDSYGTRTAASREGQRQG